MYLSLVTYLFILLVLAYIMRRVFVLVVNNDPENHSEMPPSLIRLPFLGNIYYMFKYRLPPHEMFQGLVDKLGPVFTFWFGDKPVVLINDSNTARVVLYDKTFAGRPQRQTGYVYSRGFKGIITTDYGTDFKKRSKMFHKSFQATQSYWFDAFIEETDHFLTSIQNEIDIGHQEQNVFHRLNLTSINCFWKMLSNKRLNLHSPVYNKINRMLKLLRQGIAVSNLLDGFPVLRHVPFASYLFMDACTKLRDQILKENLQDRDSANRYSGVFVNHLLNNAGDIFEESMIDMLLSDTLVAGIEATRKSLLWIVFNLTIYDEARKKCRDEISKLKNGKSITLYDMNDLHYLRAVVSETLRLNPPTVFSVPHKTMENTHIEKYKIPKDTVVLINIHAIHMDQDVHQNPELFSPERFLDVNGNYRTIDGYLPFGLGQRQCVGKHIAIGKCMFFIAKLLDKFDLKKPETFDMRNFKHSKCCDEPLNFTVHFSNRTKE